MRSFTVPATRPRLTLRLVFGTHEELHFPDINLGAGQLVVACYLNDAGLTFENRYDQVRFLLGCSSLNRFVLMTSCQNLRSLSD